MSFYDKLSKSFKILYEDIDSQLNNHSRINSFILQSDDVQILHTLETGQVFSKDIDKLINTAEEFKDELKNVRTEVEKRKLRRKSSSIIPPVWNEEKLCTYIETVVDNIFSPEKEHEEKIFFLNEKESSSVRTTSTVKPILRMKNIEPSKRNISTNVKFQLHQQKMIENSKNDKTIVKLSNKKNQAKSETILKLKSSDNLNVRQEELATSNTEKSKLMTTLCLPKVSIKGSCSIQKIYQLEISSKDDAIKDEGKNSKFFEYSHCQPSSNPVKFSNQPSNENSEKVVDREETQNNNFVDIRDLNHLLSGIQLRDGKMHIVVEKSGIRKSHKKAKTRKSLKPSTLKESIDDLEKLKRKDDDNEEEKINICTDILSQDKMEKKIETNIKINEMDSSMSSISFDDEKVCQILKVNRNIVEERHSSSENISYPSSTVNSNNSFPVKCDKSIHFQSIYKLIEETFQPTDVIESKRNDLDDKMKQMREIIKLSEENIKRAGILLQKYHPHENNHQHYLKYHKNDEAKITETEISKLHSPTIRNDMKEASINIASSQIESNIHHRYETNLVNSIKETIESSAQTIEDKTIQTETNFNSRSRQYFGHVYNQISNLDHIDFKGNISLNPRHNNASSFCECFGCNKRRTYHACNEESLVETVVYNPVYSDDNEVIRAANRFLRSVEKQKFQNDEKNVNISKIESQKKVFSPSTSSSSRSNSSRKFQIREDYENNQIEVENTTMKVSKRKAIHFSSPQSTPTSLSDLQLNQELHERYLSEGEVQSQGEYQSELSDDDVPDDIQ